MRRTDDRDDLKRRPAGRLFYCRVLLSGFGFLDAPGQAIIRAFEQDIARFL
ncbi:MAG: hypothetical protein J0G95_05550 [Rhizobiales bacterium]|nr:hypothetical protein [Hyphomicrobiales bacterium]